MPPRCAPAGSPVVVQWARSDNDSVVFQFQGKLFIVDHSHRARELFATPPDWIRTFDFSRDNRQLVFNRVVAEADIWLATLK